MVLRAYLVLGAAACCQILWSFSEYDSSALLCSLLRPALATRSYAAFGMGGAHTYTYVIHWSAHCIPNPYHAPHTEDTKQRGTDNVDISDWAAVGDCTG